MINPDNTNEVVAMLKKCTPRDVLEKLVTSRKADEAEGLHYEGVDAMWQYLEERGISMSWVLMALADVKYE